MRSHRKFDGTIVIEMSPSESAFAASLLSHANTWNSHEERCREELRNILLDQITVPADHPQETSVAQMDWADTHLRIWDKP